MTAIAAHLTERTAARLAGVVEQLKAGIDGGMVANTIFVDAKETINRAIEEAAEKFLATGPHAQKHHQSDWWLSAYHNDAFVRGAHGVPTALKRAQKANMTEYAGFIAAELSPLAELLVSAKPLVRKRGELPKVVTPKQAAKLAKSMTCQCCARAIFAETGVIAHHGYERPGFGYQTASCMGARELPFEVSRDALGYLITRLEKMEADSVAALRAAKAEKISIRCEFTDYNAKRDVRTGNRPTLSFNVTRANFDEVQAANRDLRGDFDDLKARDISRRQSELKNLREEIKGQKVRYDGWKKTHSWNKNANSWVAA